MLKKCTLLLAVFTLLTTVGMSQENGWTTLTAGKSMYGIRYDQPGAVIVNNDLVMSCVPDPQSAFETGLYVSRPSPLKKFVLVLCSQYPGDQAYIVDTVHGRAVSRDAVPKHWSIIKWISWSPDERFALVAAAGEEPMGDMAFVDLGTSEMREIHFRDLTNNPRTDRRDRLQDFDPDAISWLTASSFQLRLDVRCNPYEYGDACDYKKILSSHPARVNLKPFSISYGRVGQVRNPRAKQRPSAQLERTNNNIRINPSSRDIIIIQTPSGGVQVSDFYKTAKHKYSYAGTTIVYIQETKNYVITYSNETNDFLIHLYAYSLAAAVNLRRIAEKDFITQLNISQNDACRLNVHVAIPPDYNEALSGKDYHLSFCPDGKPFK